MDRLQKNKIRSEVNTRRARPSSRDHKTGALIILPSPSPSRYVDSRQKNVYSASRFRPVHAGVIHRMKIDPPGTEIDRGLVGSSLLRYSAVAY